MWTGLAGPFTLTACEVDQAVPQTSPGAYALGYSNHLGTFIVQYVGRAADLKGTLKRWAPTEYRQFMFEYYPTEQAAFEKECELYHFFSPADNEEHADCRGEN